MSRETNQQALKQEIADLERKLRNAKSQLNAATSSGGVAPPTTNHIKDNGTPTSTILVILYPLLNLTLVTDHVPSPHSLLLLSDSTLPLGSFAYSSGLESYLAHQRQRGKPSNPITSFHRFLHLSISSVAGTSLPYLLAAYRNPESLEQLDNDLDASTPCTVARRASVAQGKALLSVWERAFKPCITTTSSRSHQVAAAVTALEYLISALKAGSPTTTIDDQHLHPNGHFAPLWGVVCLSMGLDLHHTAYVFLLNNAKAVLSAAVRASVMGPYQAQGVLASPGLQDLIRECLAREWETRVEDAGQGVPVLDLWVGRHELLYSRIFNS